MLVHTLRLCSWWGTGRSRARGSGMMRCDVAGASAVEHAQIRDVQRAAPLVIVRHPARGADDVPTCKVPAHWQCVRVKQHQFRHATRVTHRQEQHGPALLRMDAPARHDDPRHRDGLPDPLPKRGHRLHVPRRERSVVHRQGWGTLRVQPQVAYSSRARSCTVSSATWGTNRCSSSGNKAGCAWGAARAAWASHRSCR